MNPVVSLQNYWITFNMPNFLQSFSHGKAFVNNEVGISSNFIFNKVTHKF